MAEDSKDIFSLGDLSDLGYLEGGRGWDQLKLIISDKKRRIEAVVLAKALNGPIDASYERGFLAGLKWVLDTPAQARKKSLDKGDA